jgi:hypothetical protein
MGSARNIATAQTQARRIKPRLVRGASGETAEFPGSFENLLDWLPALFIAATVILLAGLASASLV